LAENLSLCPVVEGMIIIQTDTIMKGMIEDAGAEVMAKDQLGSQTILPQALDPTPTPPTPYL